MLICGRYTITKLTQSRNKVKQTKLRLELTTNGHQIMEFFIFVFPHGAFLNHQDHSEITNQKERENIQLPFSLIKQKLANRFWSEKIGKEELWMNLLSKQTVGFFVPGADLADVCGARAHLLSQQDFISISKVRYIFLLPC